MKINSMKLIESLQEADIIDFKDAKQKHMNDVLDHLVEVRGASLINELKLIISNAQDTITKIDPKGIYNRDYKTDLISISSELRILYRDILKEE